jgi:hypothetical protein
VQANALDHSVRAPARTARASRLGKDRQLHGGSRVPGALQRGLSDWMEVGLRVRRGLEGIPRQARDGRYTWSRHTARPSPAPPSLCPTASI